MDEVPPDKGAITRHVVLDQDLSPFLWAQSPRERARCEGENPAFEPDTVVVDDRGYNDYTLFARWTEPGIYVVTRKGQRDLRRHRGASPSPTSKDQTIRRTGVSAQQKCPHRLRRVAIGDPEQSRVLVFLTHHFGFGASTIAAIYKDRWQVELFFKALKQNLTIKTLVPPNAVKTQVWTALIAILILRYLHLKSKFACSLSNLVALLRMNLFTYRDLWAWLDEPFGTPPPSEEWLQQPLLVIT